jgi:hypothetical protein
MRKMTRRRLSIGSIRFDEILEQEPGPAQLSDKFLPRMQVLHRPCFTIRPIGRVRQGL